MPLTPNINPKTLSVALSEVCIFYISCEIGAVSVLNEIPLYCVNGKWSKGGIPPPAFWAKRAGNIGKTSPQEALTMAPTCFKFSPDALATCPQPMPSTRTLFFFGHVAGAVSTVAQEG